MPFKSKAQQGYMFVHHPAIARRWAKEYGVPKNLPAKKSGVTKAAMKRKLSKKI